jgi:outer membrane immunogenic protein
MKNRALLYSIAALTLFAGGSASAQYAKDSDDLMQSSQYSVPNDRQEDSGAYANTRREAQVTTRASSIEPAAGSGGYATDPYKDFTGPYVGGDIGYNIGSYDVNDPAGPDGDVGLDGFEGGLFLGYGYNHNFSWLGGYAGLELGYEWSGADGQLAGGGYEKDHAWLVTFRPGIAMHEDALAYGVIGYSRAEFESNGNEEDLDGLVLGAGSEFSTRSPVKLRLEYTYTTYEDANLGNVNFDGHENQLKAGAVFRF